MFAQKKDFFLYSCETSNLNLILYLLHSKELFVSVQLFIIFLTIFITSYVF